MSESDEFGRDVGRELGHMVARTQHRIYRTCRKMRSIDGACLGVLLLLMVFGVFWRLVFIWFAASFILDCFLCWRLNPKRQARGASG